MHGRVVMGEGEEGGIGGVWEGRVFVVICGGHKDQPRTGKGESEEHTKRRRVRSGRDSWASENTHCESN